MICLRKFLSNSTQDDFSAELWDAAAIEKENVYEYGALQSQFNGESSFAFHTFLVCNLFSNIVINNQKPPSAESLPR